MTAKCLAIDIGATKIAIGIVNIEGQVESRVDIATQVSSQHELNASLKEAIENQISTSGSTIDLVGIGSAGPIDLVKGAINPVNIPAWRDFPLIDFVKQAANTDKVLMVGDASALSFAEFAVGAAKGFQNVLGVVVSTGIGGGTVIDGKHHIGFTGNASFIGHSIIEIDGPTCACGAKGCVEVFSSGPSMAKWAHANGLEMKSPDDFHEVAQQARNGNAIALEAIRRGANALAIGLTNAVAIIDLDAIVVGGGVMNAADVFWQPLEEAFNKHMRNLGFGRDCQILKAKLGSDSGLAGAGLVALHAWHHAGAN
ncbi:MAG: hypothetical protein RLZZ471_408 [Actinomycetota bacterium]